MSIITLTTFDSPSGRKIAKFEVDQQSAHLFNGLSFDQFFVDNVFGIAVRSGAIVVQTTIGNIDFTIADPTSITVNGKSYLESEMDILLTDLLAIAFY